MPVDPSGGNNPLDGDDLRWGAVVPGVGPTTDGWMALVFEPKSVFEEAQHGDDVNKDGDAPIFEALHAALMEPGVDDRLQAGSAAPFIGLMATVSLNLAVFNLLPIPPLDGGRILTALLPSTPAMALARLEPYGMLILVGLIVFDKELGIIHLVTGTLAKSVSGTILSTALSLRPGVTE